MMRTRRSLLHLAFAALLLSLTGPRAAAAADKVAWTGRLEPKDARAGESAQVVVQGTIEAPWHIYSLTESPGGGPAPTTIELAPGKALLADGKPVQPAPVKKFDEGFKKEVEIYEGAVAFGLPVKLAPGTAGKQQAVLKLKYQACNESMCLPPKKLDLPVQFTVAAGPARADHEKPVTTVPKQPGGSKAGGDAAAVPPTAGSTAAPPPPPTGGFANEIEAGKRRGLLSFIWLSLGMGFLALLTPCVFPLVPITVSFFAKQQETAPGSGLRSAAAYCLGIIGTFTALGLIMTAVFGAGGIQKLATQPVVNLALATLFIALALNLFGAFEILVPGWMLERAHAGSRNAGLVGPLLMGLTFSLTSFTCTVAFVGTLLAAAATGDWMWPAVGMLAFSTAFSLPFFLLALFPQWLAKLPRSGSWLITVKAFMGFLELAAAVKFISNADLVWQWGLITRPVFLAIWFGIAATAGLYMLGALRLGHADQSGIGPVRRVIGAATLVSAFWCLLAINGRSLGELNAFLPPSSYGGSSSAGEIAWTEDYDAALARAKAEGKPLFLNFTGVTCTNCRLMENNVFPLPEITGELQHFVPVELFTDKDDPRSARYKKLEEDMFETVALPYYAVVTPDGKKLGEFPGLTRDPRQFADFLRKARTDAATMARTP